MNYMCNKFLINALYLVEEYHYFPLCCNFSWGIQLKIFLMGRDGGFWGEGGYFVDLNLFHIVGYFFFRSLRLLTKKEKNVL